MSNFGATLRRKTDEVRATLLQKKVEDDNREIARAWKSSVEIYNKVIRLFEDQAPKNAAKGESVWGYSFGDNEWPWLLEEHKNGLLAYATRQGCSALYYIDRYPQADPQLNHRCVNTIRVTW